MDRTPYSPRCGAVHAEDRSPCIGPQDAVSVLDGVGGAVAGCEHHGTRMLVSITGARVEPGAVVGAATRVFVAAQDLAPFCWRAPSRPMDAAV